MTKSDVEYADDPNLTAAEKEVSVTFSRADDRIRVHSEIATVTKWLDKHPEFAERFRRVTDGTVHAINGTLPLGCLSLKGSSRKSQQPSAVTGVLPETETENGDTKS
jgi:hypothetical protein